MCAGLLIKDEMYFRKTGCDSFVRETQSLKIFGFIIRENELWCSEANKTWFHGDNTRSGSHGDKMATKQQGNTCNKTQTPHP